MKSRILEKFPATQIDTFSCTPIFIADFTERTASARGVEVADSMPKCPKNPPADMDVMQVKNPSAFSVVFATFYDHSFKDADGKDEAHTEGAFFIDNEESTFFSLYEIKDCEPTNIASYKQDIIKKMQKSSKVVRDNGIVSKKKMILGLVSFPRRNKTAFNSYFNNDFIEMTRIAKEDKINFFCSNNFSIITPSNLVANYE